jgi:hypothetical protein
MQAAAPSVKSAMFFFVVARLMLNGEWGKDMIQKIDSIHSNKRAIVRGCN